MILIFLLCRSNGPMIQQKLVHSFITDPGKFKKKNYPSPYYKKEDSNPPSIIFEFFSKSIISVSNKPSREAVNSEIRYFVLCNPNLLSKISNTFSLMNAIDKFSSFLMPSHANHQRICSDKYSRLIMISHEINSKNSPLLGWELVHHFASSHRVTKGFHQKQSRLHYHSTSHQPTDPL